MRVHWLLSIPATSISDIAACETASIRLRAAAFAANCTSDDVEITFGEVCPDIVDVLVVGKIGSDCRSSRRDDAWTSVIRAHLAAGSRVYVDYTDNHIGFASPMSSFYIHLSSYKGVNWVAPSEWLHSFLLPLIPEGGDCIIINDAIESPIIKPDTRRLSSKPFKCLWFGHASSYKYLPAYLQDVDSSEDAKIELYIISSVSILERAQALLRLPLIKAVHFCPWSLPALLELSQAVDLALIPGNPMDPRKAGVGCNRLATSLALGLPVFAAQYSSYRQFETFYEPLTRDCLVSLNADLLLAMKRRLAESQYSLLNPFTLESIGKQWANLLLA